MFWIELFLILHMAARLVDRLDLNLPTSERNALAVFSGLGIKSVFLFIFLIFDLSRFIFFPLILTLLLYLLYFAWMKVRPLASDESSTVQVDGKELHWYPGISHEHPVFWVLAVLFILGFANAWFFPITGADGIWHHVKGMVYSFPNVDFESEQIISQFRQYPPLIGLLYGWLISADIEFVAIIFPILYPCLLVVVYYRVLEHVESSTVAGAAALLVGTTPYLWWHSFLPFLDWTAGVFYAVGTLYWFSLVKAVSAPGKAQSRPLAVLSGLFFGLASWTRPEFVLYSALPMFLLVCVFDQNGKWAGERNPVIARFAISALILPSLWFAVLLNFDGPLDSTFKQLIMVCAGLWLGLGLVLSGVVRLTPRVSIGVSIFAVAVGLVGLFFVVPPDVSLWTALSVRFFRLFAVHIFFAGTVFLAVFLFTERLRQLPLAEKSLGILLLLFLLTQFFIYAYSGLKWPTLSDFVYNTFVHPGNSINLSDTRGTLGIYPAFVFFIFCLPRIRVDIGSRSVRRILLAIVAINLTVILVVFAGPRIKFIADNFGKSHGQLAETSGPSDLPNQFAKTYQVAHQLKKKKEYVTQSLFLPPGDKEGSIRSVMHQVLFLGKLHFADDPDFKQALKKEVSQGRAYGVSLDGVTDTLCYGIWREALGDTGFILCKMDEYPVSLSEQPGSF